MNKFQGLLAAVILFVIVYAAAWYGGALFVRSQIETALAATADMPEQITCGDLDIGGFPFRYDITCANVRYVAGDTEITVPRVEATIRVYSPTHALVFADGPAEITNAFTGGRRQLHWESLRGSARTNGLALVRVSITGSEIVMSDALVDAEIWRVGDFEAHVLDSPELYDPETGLAELALFARLGEADYPDLGIAGGRAIFEATVPGVPDDLREWTPRTLAANWQTDPIELVRLEASDERASLESTGRLSVADDGTFNGDFDLFSTDLHETLQPAVAPELLDIVLGDIGENGRRYRAYAVRHGVVMAGNAPLFTLPPLY